MPARGTGKHYQRGSPCHNCGGDDWRKAARGGYVCVTCDREGAKRRKREQREDRAFRIWESAKLRAVEKMVAFTITVEDVKRVWPADNKCPVFGLALESGTGFAHDGSPTLDRINPEWGYEPQNVAVISLKANRAKGGLTADELECIVRWMRTTGLR